MKEKIEKADKKKEERPDDYRKYRFTAAEGAGYTAAFLILDAAVSYLFFRSWIAFFILLPAALLFFSEIRSSLGKKREEAMRSQFLTGIQLVSQSLQAGYAAENAFREAQVEIAKIHGPESLMAKEFSLITARTGVGVSLEDALTDLGERSGVEDIRTFAEVFCTARRSGGDISSIAGDTAAAIRQKDETMMEISAVLSGKMMEQTMMSFIPLFILSYVSLTSPGFFEPMYHNLPGILVMSLALGVYAAAFFWGRRIVSIEI